MPKNKTQLYLLLAVIFLSGIIIGGLPGIFIGSYLHYKMGPRKEHGRHRRKIKERIFCELKHDLNLSAEQQTQVTEILEQAHKYHEKMRYETMLKMKEQIKDSFDKIETLLDSQQKEKFKLFRQKMKDRFKRHRRHEKGEERHGPQGLRGCDKIISPKPE